MEYYKLLQLDREPFSNSPDPDYFFQSGQHRACLQKLELALRLKRGLNIVIGDVGTGKTTLCRQLIRMFSEDPDFESHLILDPSFDSAHEFIKQLFAMTCETEQAPEPSNLEMKEFIKRNLFSKGVDQGKTLVLIIDEGQKITASCIEILRELLNYETNAYKLLQIVIFAQLEFEEILKTHANFTDRINLLHYLHPMNFKDTRRMVQHRLKLAATAAGPQRLFTLPAMWAIYRASKGYPRKIIHLCHQSMLAMIIQNRSRAGWALIRSCRRRIGPPPRPAHRLSVVGSLAVIGLLLAMGFAPKFISSDKESVSPPTAEKIPPMPVPATTEAPTDNVESKTINAPLLPSVLQHQPAAVQDSPTAMPLDGSESNQAEITGVQGPTQHPSRPVPSIMPPVDDPPDNLGKLPVRPGDTMVGMVQAVYGTHHNRYLRAVIEANAHIQNPNTIDIGQIISFPAIQFKPKSDICPCWWVILGEGSSLSAASKRLNDLSAKVKHPLRLICSWSPQSGTRFQVAFNGYYESQDEALVAVQSLPREIASGSDLVSDWPPETIFYSSPTAGGIRHF